jgi:hypothetical protein
MKEEELIAAMNEKQLTEYTRLKKLKEERWNQMTEE